MNSICDRIDPAQWNALYTNKGVVAASLVTITWIALATIFFLCVPDKFIARGLFSVGLLTATAISIIATLMAVVGRILGTKENLSMEAEFTGGFDQNAINALTIAGLEGD